ncbi:MAG: hypothetical protein ACYS0H_16105 [Planctomycetota bacterium]|jgi:hypothetical protein
MPVKRKRRAHGRSQPPPKTAEQVAGVVLATIARAGTELHNAVYAFPDGNSPEDVLEALGVNAKPVLDVMELISAILAPDVPVVELVVPPAIPEVEDTYQ